MYSVRKGPNFFSGGQPILLAPICGKEYFFSLDCLGTVFCFFVCFFFPLTFKLRGFLLLVESASDSTRSSMFLKKPHSLIFSNSLFCRSLSTLAPGRMRALVWDHHGLPLHVIKTLKIKGAFRDYASPGLLC